MSMSLWLIPIFAYIAIYFFIGYKAYSTAKKMFKKYQKYQKLENIDQKYSALIRDDYASWNRQKILIGCFTLFPFRILAFASMLLGCLFFATLMTIFGTRTIFDHAFSFYLNNYGKIVGRIMISIEQQFEDKTILTPIVISNHTCWFDIFYFVMGYAPLSFVAKQEVSRWPIIGALSKAIKCIFVKRSSEVARLEAREGIKKRIQEVNNSAKNKYPIVIFPEGTTSNGKGLLTFKNGAFEHLSSITAFCLKYQCDDCGMGLDEISQTEHAICMLSLLPKIVVKKNVFYPKMGQTSNEYEKRCREQMGKALQIPCTEGGYRQKLALQEIRNKKKI